MCTYVGAGDGWRASKQGVGMRCLREVAKSVAPAEDFRISLLYHILLVHCIMFRPEALPKRLIREDNPAWPIYL